MKSVNMTIASKFEKQKFGEWTVVDFYKKNNYKKVYANGKNIQHNAYTYILVNADESQLIKLSGNTLRLLNNGSRKIEQIISAKRKNIV